MKKYMPGLLIFFFSLIAALLIFGITCLVIMKAAGLMSDPSPIYFSEDGEMLNFFGETLYISENAVDNILSYPGKALNFGLSFMPESIERPARFFLDAFSQSFGEFTDFTVNVVGDILTIGTVL